MRTLLIALTLTAATSAVAQDTTLIVPNGKMIRGTLVKPYSKKFNMYRVKDGVEEKSGTLSDDYTIIKKAKSEQGLRVVNIKLSSFEILDSGYVNAETLDPIYHRSHQTNKTIHLDFKTNNVSGVVNSGTNKETVNATYDSPFFDSYFENFIAASVPLKKGFTFKFAEFIDNKTGLVWSSGEVSDIFSMKLNSKIWLVRLYEIKRGRVTSFWLDSERQLLQWEYNFNGNISRTRLEGVDQI